MADGLVAVVLLVTVGLAPAVIAARSLLIGLVLAPLVGGLIATVAAVAALATGAAPIPWLVALAGTAAVVALVVGHRMERSPWSWGGDVAGHRGWVVVLLVAVLALPFMVVVRPPIDWDAQSIWAHRATWFQEGGGVGREAFGESQAVFSHPDYPPLLSAAGGMAAAVTDAARTSRGVQAAGAAMAWSALAVLALQFLQVGPRRSWVWVVAAGLGGVAGCAFAGVRIANGEADFLWSAAAAAAGLGLLRPRARARDLVVPAIACAVCVLTKNEGMVAGGLIVLGALVVQRRLPERWWLLALLAPAAAWVVLGGIWSADPGPVIQIGDASLLDRARLTSLGIAGEAGLPFLVAVAVTAALVTPPFHRARRRVMWGVLAMWGVVAVSIVPIFVTYITGPYEIGWWLETSVARTMIAPRVALASVVALVFAAVADAGPVSKGGEEPADATDDVPGRHLTVGSVSGVSDAILHPAAP